MGLIIHSHPIKDEDVAFQVETAVMDAYAGLANKVSGHRSGRNGPMHVDEVISAYSAEPFAVTEPLILITISRTYGSRDTMKATQAAWVVARSSVEPYNLVLGHSNGIVGAVPTGRRRGSPGQSRTSRGWMKTCRLGSDSMVVKPNQKYGIAMWASGYPISIGPMEGPSGT